MHAKEMHASNCMSEAFSIQLRRNLQACKQTIDTGCINVKLPQLANCSVIWWCCIMQAATGEDVSAEELGGAELHCTTSGKDFCLWAVRYITRLVVN